MDKIFDNELVMENHSKVFKSDEAETIMKLEETFLYYEKYIYRNLRFVEQARQYAILAQQE